MDRRTPFDEIERLFERMGKQFEDVSGQWEGASPRAMLGAPASIDVADRGDEFAVTAELPGFSADDVDLRVADQTLYLDAERSEESAVEEENFVHQERSRESVARHVRLPEPVDTDGVTATLEDGVLSVTIPKAVPDSSGQRIDIE